MTPKETSPYVATHPDHASEDEFRFSPLKCASASRKDESSPYIYFDMEEQMLHMPGISLFAKITTTKKVDVQETDYEILDPFRPLGDAEEDKKGKFVYTKDEMKAILKKVMR